MHQDGPGSIVSPLLDHCPPTLISRAYFTIAAFEHDLKNVWSKNWNYVGRLNDLPISAMRRISIAGENLVLIRDGEGKVTCFHNTCRHRGSELCSVTERSLKSRLIVCPYHQWSYATDGRLIQVPFASPTGDFDKAEHSLLPVRTHVWNGFIFVCIADNPPPFSEVPDMGETALNNWPMDELVTGHTLVKTIDCNWKVFWENYNECLHCPGIHPELCDLVPVYGRGYMTPEEAPDWNGQVASGGPLKEGARTWTLSGKPCGPEFAGLMDSQREAGHYFVTLLPTMFIVAHIDYVRVVSLKPLGPEKTELRAEWLFQPETLRSPKFDLDNVVKFATMVLMQDAEACEMNQRGLKSGRYSHGTLMPQEFDVYRFHQWVRQRTDYGAALKEEL